MEPLLPNEQRAKAAIMLIWIVMGLQIAAIGSNYLQYNLLKDALGSGSGSVTPGRIMLNDFRQLAISILFLAGYIFSTVTFIKWFRRAYANLHLRVNYLNHSEGWAAGCWFVPILNLYRPIQIMSELYKETDELLLKKKIISKSKYNATYITLWWILWILSGLVGNIFVHFSNSGNSIEALMSNTMGDIIVGLLTIPLGFVTIKVIKDYAAVEPLLALVPEEQPITPAGNPEPFSSSN